MRKRLTICLVCLFWLAGNYSSCAGADSLCFLDWRITRQERGAAGEILTTYTLFFPAHSFNEPEILCRRTELGRFGSSQEHQSVEIFELKPVKTDGGWEVTIYSGSAERIELWAGLAHDDRFYLAQTIFNAYGNSDSAGPQTEKHNTWPDETGFRPLFGKKFYRAVTGEPLDFELAGLNPSLLHIYENGQKIEASPSIEDGGFYRYIPPHDSRLAAEGFSARNDLTFVALDETRQTFSTFYLPVYRNSYGQLNLKAGLGLVAASAAVTLGFVWLAGRRFRWR